MFKHPKYYKELRKARNELAKRNAVKEDLASSGSSPARNKSDQAISLRARDGECERATGPGHKLQASEDSTANSTRGRVEEPEATSSQASSGKRQAPSRKRQASSRKLQAP